MGIISLGLSLRFAVGSLLYKLRLRRDVAVQKVIMNGHVSKLDDNVFEATSYGTCVKIRFVYGVHPLMKGCFKIKLQRRPLFEYNQCMIIIHPTQNTSPSPLNECIYVISPWP